MQALATKAATSAVKSKVKSTLKELPKPDGPKRRGAGSVGGQVEGFCNKCCGALCRNVSPWRQVICWAMISLTVATVILFFAGGFLVGSAKSASGSPCGVTLTIPVFNKDAYIWFLTSTGIMVFVMIFISSIFCCSTLILCCGNFPKPVTIIGVIGIIITILGLSVYAGWVAMGTFFVIKIHSADVICRDTLIYVILLYVYLAVFVLLIIIISCWKCNECRNTWKSTRKLESKTYRKLPQDDHGTT